ncbi:methyl-CPG-binding domain protein 13 [Perilla frutescens var. hirtella]|nr:methyl-CPG-binding domain protein 13 [Perilla frutescens var. hirtella]
MGSENPDWLPVDWKVSVKIRKFGRRDKYYIHPSTGLTLSSKPEVLRYLETSGKSSNSKETNKINIKKTVAEQLPPGWIKEIKIKKNKGKTRRDLYYIDPVNGKQFRSMPEVFRYLKSKDSGEAEPKPDDKGHTSMELVDPSQSSSAQAKGQRSIVKKGDKNMTERERIKSGPAAAASKNIEKALVEESCKESDSVTEKLQNKLPCANGEERQNGGRRISKRLAGIKLQDDAKDHTLQSGLETAAENNMKIPEKKGLEQREKKNICTEETQQHEPPASQKKRKPTNGKLMNNLPRRTSKRLACLEVNQSVEVKTSDQGGASARLSSNGEVDSTKNAGTCGQSDEPEIDNSVKFGGMDSDEQCRTENPTNDKQKEATADENLSSEEHKSVGAVHHEDEKHEKHLDSSLKNLLMDPCIEFAIKTLTGAIPIEDVNKADDNPVSSNQRLGCSSASPCDDIWSDPCFEFAVKTLTGEMPAEDDGLKFQISYKKPPSSSGLDSGPLPKNAVMKQEGVWHPPFARS